MVGSTLIYNELINTESKGIIKESDSIDSSENHSQSDDTKESKGHKQSIMLNEAVFKVKKLDRSKSVALRKDIINKSIIRAFTKYYNNLFKLKTEMHTINGCQYDSLKAHIREIFDSTSLLKLFMKQSASTCELGRFKIIDLLSDLHIHCMCKSLLL